MGGEAIPIARVEGDALAEWVSGVVLDLFMGCEPVGVLLEDAMVDEVDL